MRSGAAAERPQVSVVVPVFNELGCLEELYRRTVAVMEGTGAPFELVVVDDGSSDGSLDLLHALAGDDERVVVLSLSRNFGQQIAVTAGLDHARGDAVVVLDADLQDPPEVIPELLRLWREGHQVVVARRDERRGESRFKVLTASVFYRVLRRLSALDVPLDAGDFRLLDRRVVDVLSSMPERHRFLRGLSAWAGFRQGTVAYRRDPRFSGTTKYPWRTMLRLALDAVTSFSDAPLRLATWFGFFLALLSLLLIPLVVVLRLLGTYGFGGQTTVLLAVLFFASVQLLCIGILGQYVGRIYDETKRRPLYVVAGGPPGRRTPARPSDPMRGTTDR